MRIVYFLPNLTKTCGGAEIYGLILCNILQKKHSVLIVTAKPQKGSFPAEQLFSKYNIEPVDIRYLNLHSFSHDFPLYVERQLKVNWFLRRNKPDLFINGTYGRLVVNKKTRAIQIIHFPSDPFTGVFSHYLNSRYVKSYLNFFCNSFFTKKYMDVRYGVKSLVLNPPVTMKIINRQLLMEKQNIILAVDRFVEDKKIREMVLSFKKLFNYNKSYRLVVIGNIDKGEIAYYNEIVNSLDGYPISILTNVTQEELIRWYRKAKIFWHAKGYDVGDDNPLAMEHFGMTTVEAMTNGCIPVVINKAGQKEIMENRLQELLWDTLDELIKKTLHVIDDSSLIERYQQIVLEEAERYQIKHFEKKINSYLEMYS